MIPPYQSACIPEIRSPVPRAAKIGELGKGNGPEMSAAGKCRQAMHFIITGGRGRTEGGGCHSSWPEGQIGARVPGFWRVQSVGCSVPRRLVIEQEFLRVDQRPDDVLVGGLGILAMLRQVGRGDLHLLVVRLAGVDPAVQFAALRSVGRPFVGGQ